MTKSPLLWSIVPILGWLPINFWASADRDASWEAIVYLFVGIILYGICIGLPIFRRRQLWVVWGLISVGLLLATIGAPLIRWKPEFRLFYIPFYERITTLPSFTSETIHANVLAGVLLICLPLLLSLVATSNVHRHLWQTFLLVTMILVVGIMLILTQSRGAYLGCLVGIILWMILRWPRLRWGIPVVAIILFLFFRQVDIDWLVEGLSAGDSLGGWAGRLDIWTQSARALQDFIFTGIGIGTFQLVIPLLYPLRVNIEGFPHAHNLFLQVGLDLGLPGLIAYLSILLTCFYMLVMLIRDRSDLQRWNLSVGAASALVGMLVHGLFDAVLWGTKVAFVSWLLFALISLLHKQQVESSPSYSDTA